MKLADLMLKGINPAKARTEMATIVWLALCDKVAELEAQLDSAITVLGILDNVLPDRFEQAWESMGTDDRETVQAARKMCAEVLAKPATRPLGPVILGGGNGGISS